MAELQFEWDEVKAALNLKKHNIAFSEAKTVFADDFARLIPDPDHSSQTLIAFLVKSVLFCSAIVISKNYCWFATANEAKMVFALFLLAKLTNMNANNTRAFNHA